MPKLGKSIETKRRLVVAVGWGGGWGGGVGADGWREWSFTGENDKAVKGLWRGMHKIPKFALLWLYDYLCHLEKCSLKSSVPQAPFFLPFSTASETSLNIQPAVSLHCSRPSAPVALHIVWFYTVDT